MNDGAAMIIATEAGLGVMDSRLARIVSSAVAGVHPDIMGIGPVPATRLALERAGIGEDDRDLIELNGHSLPISGVIAIWARSGPRQRQRETIALGHPLGPRKRILPARPRVAPPGGRYGLATMCIGVGRESPPSSKV